MTLLTAARVMASPMYVGIGAKGPVTRAERR